MPTAITHQLLAEEVYAAMPEAIREKIFSLPHYYLGAQGPDFWFAHGAFSAGENFGRSLHTRRPLLFFRLLSEAGQRNRNVFSYAMGYITHYAADTVFHPYVYGLMEALEREGKYLHHAIEHAVDGALLKSLRGVPLMLYRLPAVKGIDLRGIYEVYARYARATGRDEPTPDDLARAVRRYYAMNAVRTPLYRAEYALPAAKLFSRAKGESLRLAEIFSSEKELSAHDFGRSFLSGEIV